MRRFPGPLKALQYGRSAPPGNTRSAQLLSQGSLRSTEGETVDTAKCGERSRRRVAIQWRTESVVVPAPSHNQSMFRRLSPIELGSRHCTGVNQNVHGFRWRHGESGLSDVVEGIAERCEISERFLRRPRSPSDIRVLTIPDHPTSELHKSPKDGRSR